MRNVTRMKILAPAKDVFEAFVDPEKIGNFWFSSSSEKWAQGKTITLIYQEYDAQGEIQIKEIEEDRKIVFEWGANGDGHTVTIMFNQLNAAETIVEVTEEGFNERDKNFLEQIIDNKEGWVFMLTCLKGYLEYGVNGIRGGLVK